MVSAVRMLSAEQQGRVEVAADLLGGELCQPSGFTGLSGTDQGRTWDDRSDQQGHDLTVGPPCAPNETA